MEFSFPVLIGDIGGTNARYCLIESPHQKTGSCLNRIFHLAVKKHSSLEDGIAAQILPHLPVRPKTTILALACPVDGKSFKLTNADITLKPKKFLNKTGSEQLFVMNDFTAQALAAASLKPSHLEQLFKKRQFSRVPNAPRIIIGPGTGLGTAMLVSSTGKWNVVNGEGGHVDFGPVTKAETEIWPFLRRCKGRITPECVISGKGLENIYQALCRAKDIAPSFKRASQISAAANQSANIDRLAKEATRLMALMLARFAGDLALISKATGGVYLTGGVTRHILPMIRSTGFEKSFKGKAPMDGIMKKIPIYVLAHPQPGLFGITETVANPQAFNLTASLKSFSS